MLLVATLLHVSRYEVMYYGVSIGALRVVSAPAVQASIVCGRGKNGGSTHAILIAPGSEQTSDDLRGDGHG